MIGQVFEKDGKRYIVPMKDIFYYAKLNGIPVYFQPEENEIVGRNWFCELLLKVIMVFEPLFVSEEGFKIEIEHRTITREEIE